MNNIQFASMEQLFNVAGYNYKEMDINRTVDIFDKKIFIKSFNHDKSIIEFARVTHLTRKNDSIVWELKLKYSKDILLSSSANHFVWDEKNRKYIEVCLVNPSTLVKLENGRQAEVISEKTDRISPILDLTVENNHNYFSNGILSKNSGGKSLPYYSSLRLEVSSKRSKDTDNLLDMRVKVIKNKLAPAGKKAELWQRY